MITFKRFYPTETFTPKSNQKDVKIQFGCQFCPLNMYSLSNFTDFNFDVAIKQFRKQKLKESFSVTFKKKWIFLGFFFFCVCFLCFGSSCEEGCLFVGSGVLFLCFGVVIFVCFCFVLFFVCLFFFICFFFFFFFFPYCIQWSKQMFFFLLLDILSSEQTSFFFSSLYPYVYTLANCDWNPFVYLDVLINFSDELLIKPNKEILLTPQLWNTK